jgi:hypothetical protein
MASSESLSLWMFSMTELKPRTKFKPLLVVARYDDDLCMLREDASGFESDSIDGRASDQDYLKSVRACSERTQYTPFLPWILSEKAVATSSAVVVDVKVGPVDILATDVVRTVLRP